MTSLMTPKGVKSAQKCGKYEKKKEKSQKSGKKNLTPRK